MSAQQLDQANFQKDVLDQKGVVLVDFYAEWCGPCKITSPIIDELSEEKKDIKFFKVDVDKNSDIASGYNIFSIPTFIIFKDGKPVNQFAGAQSKDAFVSELSKVA
jgi:thioredoxin 1